MNAVALNISLAPRARVARKAAAKKAKKAHSADLKKTGRTRKAAYDALSAN